MYTKHNCSSFENPIGRICDFTSINKRIKLVIISIAPEKI
jgi:hypothetical protein